VDVTCRTATAEDAEALALLRWEMRLEQHPEEQGDRAAFVAACARQTRPELARGTYCAWLAEVGREPVAGVLLIWSVMPPHFDRTERKRGFVSSVYTRPAYRRQGIGRRLMSLLVEHARREYVQALVLWSSEMGQPFYESLGFQPSNALELDL
jgi:ribosomal protein S18 acetylase RimI-like enzyme